MKKILKISICCALLLVCGCTYKSKKDIESNLIHMVNNYATPDIFAFLEKYNSGQEEYRGINDDDLGSWQLVSSIRRDEGKTTIVEGMRLDVNLNSQKITGAYSYKSYISGEYAKDEVNQEYQLYYDREGYHLIDEVADESLKQRILNFKFTFQYVDLDQNVVSTYPVEEKKYTIKPSKEHYIAYKFRDESILKKIKEVHPYIKNTDKTLLTLDDSYGGELAFKFNDKHNTELSESITFKATEEFSNLEQIGFSGANDALQRLYALYPTRDLNTLFTTKAALNDHTQGRWIIRNEYYRNDVLQESKRFEVNKEYGTLSGNYVNDITIPIEYSVDGYKPIGKENKEYQDKINKVKLLLEVLEIDTESLSTAENEVSYHSAQWKYTLRQSDSLFVNFQKIFSDIDSANEIYFSISLSKDTNLIYALGKPEMSVEYTSTSGDKIKVVESLYYFHNHK